MQNKGTGNRCENSAMPSWAGEQLALRYLLENWISQEIDRYDREGFDGLFAGKGGHALDEAGGYTRSFVSAFCLNGDRRIEQFMKRFRDDWHHALTESGHFYHGYDSNEEGDYITHTAEAFTQFLLNVLYLDISDEKTVSMVEDAAEHLGNWNPEVQDWYDWDKHVFLSYFLGTRSSYHKPPYNRQSTRHFRVLAIASAAFEATGRQRYLDLCRDYWATWSDRILAAPEAEVPMSFKLIDEDEIRSYAARKDIMDDWRFHHYYKRELSALGLMEEEAGKDESGHPAWKDSGVAPKHIPHDLVMTMLDVMRFVHSDASIQDGLRRVMQWWISQGVDGPSQIAGIDPHCGVHLPKYRDITGDTGMNDIYLGHWPTGPCSYLLTGDASRLTGVAGEAEIAFRRALARNSGEFGPEFINAHACGVTSNAGTTSAYVMPALFMPALGGLGVHYGRAPWLNVLYYTEAGIGLPVDVAALYVPCRDGSPPHVKLANCGDRSRKIAVRRIDPAQSTGLVLTAGQPAGLTEITLNPGQVKEAEL